MQGPIGAKAMKYGAVRQDIPSQILIHSSVFRISRCITLEEHGDKCSERRKLPLVSEKKYSDSPCESGDLDGTCKRQSRSTLSPSNDMLERYPHGLQVKIKP